MTSSFFPDVPPFPVQTTRLCTGGGGWGGGRGGGRRQTARCQQTPTQHNTTQRGTSVSSRWLSLIVPVIPLKPLEESQRRTARPWNTRARHNKRISQAFFSPAAPKNSRLMRFAPSPQHSPPFLLHRRSVSVHGDNPHVNIHVCPPFLLFLFLSFRYLATPWLPNCFNSPRNASVCHKFCSFNPENTGLHPLGAIRKTPLVPTVSHPLAARH